MKPSQVSSKLRQIAATIEASESPRSDLVSQDLRRVILAVAGYKATIFPEGPGSQVYGTGATAEEAVREAYRGYFRQAWSMEPSDADLDAHLKDVEIRNGAIYDDGHPTGDVGPV